VKQKQTFDTTVHDLQSQLQEVSSDYLLIDRLSNQHVDIKFIGNFQGQPIVWNACIRTMHDYYELELKNTSNENVELRQFIDIEKKNNGYRIALVLNLDKIDDAAIQKSIIMVRNYKRLSLGKHEYGEARHFNND